MTSFLVATVLLICLGCFLPNSDSEVAKDENVRWVARAEGAIFPAPLAMRARRIALIDQSLNTLV